MAGDSINNQTTTNAILWLTRTGFYLYPSGFNQVISLAFPIDVVNHLEIINEDKLTELISAFIKQHQLPALNVFVVIAPDGLIETVLPSADPKAVKQTEKTFLEMVPFETIYSIKETINQQTKLAAFNGNFYQIFAKTLEKFNWKIVAVSPYFITGQSNFSQSLAQSLLTNSQLLIHHNFISTDIYIAETNDKNHTATDKKDSQPPKSSLIWLLPVFFILLLILILTLILTSSKNPAINQKNIPTTGALPALSPSPTVIPLITISPTNISTHSGNLDNQPALTPTNYPITITP